MSISRVIAIIWTIAAFALMLWGWATYSGPFRWAAEWQVEQFGSYNEKLTIFGPLIVLLIPAGFLVGWGPLLPPAVTTPEQRVANARRNARIIAVLGVVALLIGATGGALGYQKLHTPTTQAELVLTSGAEPAPAADLVTLTAVARTDLIVGFQETVGGSTQRWSFIPLVGQTWRPGEPIRFLLRTNQTAWLPPASAQGMGKPQMLQRGNPPFRMITQPSVLKRHALPGIVQAEYEKARVALDPAVAVVEQSADEVYAPYWMTAFGGGLVGVCLLLAGLIGAINAPKAARSGAV